MFTGLGFGAGRAWEECDSVSLAQMLEGLRRGLVNSHEADVSKDAFDSRRPCDVTARR